jgi:deazaflavin-dependent oxidoreductase (nitroreductase family)
MSSWLAAHALTENCHLTTTGRRTGNQHEVEIWFGVIGDTLYLISGNGVRSDWYRNALATPAVAVRIDEELFTGVAREVTDTDERRAVGELMGAKYPSYEDPSIGLTREAWCFQVPAMAISGWSSAG